ncbi:MAG: aspartyl/asparaginyl beta-hydroxylase domain-containing protein [Gammaproteobacteria bacterium]|nr:aspartyl/asparaginyl beta-hydroxylase domain-containing protein [Gammaproteobacteria bacterium]
MANTDQSQNELCNRAIEAELAGDPQAALPLYRQAINVNRGNPVPYLFLGYLRHGLQDSEAAVQAWSLAADLDPRVLNAWRSDTVAADIRQRSKLADRELRRHFTRLHKSAIAAYASEHPDANVERAEAAIWCQTHDEEFQFNHPEQRPHLFFVPGISSIPVYDESHLAWKSLLESSFEAIRTEFLAARTNAAAEQRPYLEPRAAWLGDDWKPIADSLNWGSYQLYRKGKGNDALIRRFPETLRIIGQLPIIEGLQGPREVVFSVLQGKQRIPPHYGVSNTDMTVHLPIITTEDSAIRVVQHVHHWQTGKVFAFDDAFEHESWNNSSQPRVNLIFEVWHPELTRHEQAAISATFDARDRWNQTRTI